MSLQKFEPRIWDEKLIREIFLSPPILPASDKKDYKIKQIYVNKSKLTTTVLWEDGTHTTVRLNTPEGKYIPFDVYNAVCAALAKKVYGSNTHFKKILKEKIVYQDKTRKK